MLRWLLAQFSNAKANNDLKGCFGYGGLSAGPIVNGGAVGFAGNSSNVPAYGAKLGVGAAFGPPHEIHGGASYTLGDENPIHLIMQTFSWSRGRW
jgi:hypothetical protein